MNSTRDGRTARALWIWASLIAVSFATGAILHALGVLTIDHLPPLHGHFRVLTLTLLPAVAFGGAAVLFLPVLTARLGFGGALLVSYGCALAWTVLLSVSADGPAAPMTHPQEYPAVLPLVGDDPLGWLATFTRHLPDYPTHVRGHPPLPVLVLWSLAALGPSGPLWASLLIVATGCSATMAIALTVRELGGERAARRALPYLALTPASVWIATSMDAFFAGVGAWGVALLVLGGRGGTGRRARRGYGARVPRGGRGRTARRLCWGLGAGVLLGSLPYLSYGLVPYLLIPVAAAVAARVPREAVLAALAGAATVTAAFAAAGFLWPAGVLATHAEWAADPGAARPYLYFLFANLGVLAMLTGPATAVGLARLGPGGSRVLVAAALVAVLALDVSGVTRGEVERIWVPYALWIGLAASQAPGRRWLAAQVVMGSLLQGLVVSPW
ncbi:hypothetical protein [Sphaerisporangium sp. TRM90804]|uniref:hypothetical protein n=1 Tax=Sphaerisporangium sp. TRM90804 TaxID=3031113 RepID=UPI002448C530|nr:hypothetical protein [Sphaerisporangium sp. TRM90804]MDH2425590.1 hypothetical protein [Sphaerisporangium sp. TRM90804]